MEMNLDLTDWQFNLNSPQQMQEFLYEFLGLPPLTEANESGNISVDESTITHYAEQNGVKFCALLIALRKLLKAKNTYLADILRNVSYKDGRIHGDFWLNVAETFRSSASNPNNQNIPKHGDIVPGLPWEYIRKLFISIAHPDWFFSEVDYVGAETKVAAMLSNDEQMISDLNEDLDMHSHWAIEIFGLTGLSYKQVKEQYNDTFRFLAKNNFTFANFFGAGNTSIAAEFRKSEFYRDYVMSFWNQLTTKKGSFENYYIQFSEDHVKGCQDKFWQRYSTYKTWQDNIVDKYYQVGYVDNPFGFRRRYPLKRNEIINFPIQSTSFLLLLDSLIQIEEKLEKENWKSHLVGQVHDSALSNVYKYEVPDFIEMVDEIMIHKPHLPWTMKVKLDTDWSFGRNWFSMFPLNDYKYINN